MDSRGEIGPYREEDGCEEEWYDEAEMVGGAGGGDCDWDSLLPAYF